MSSTGIDAITGKIKTDWDHTKQSIQKILETALGERIQRAKFGSALEDHIDRPQSAEEIMRLYVDAAEALEFRYEDGIALGEPRCRLIHIAVMPSADGRIIFDLTFIEYPNGHKGDFTPGQSPRSMAFASQYLGGAA